MAIADTQFQITIPVGYDEATRATIAVEVIRFIKERTKSGKDKDNNSLKSPNVYSKNYREHIDFKAAGKSGGPVNLTLTGEMLNSIELLDSTRIFNIWVYRSRC